MGKLNVFVLWLVLEAFVVGGLYFAWEHNLVFTIIFGIILGMLQTIGVAILKTLSDAAAKFVGSFLKVLFGIKS